MVDEALARYTCLGTYSGEDGCRGCVRSVLLGSVELDDRSATKHRMIGWVVLLGIVGMPCVSVVCRNHEGTLHGLIVGFLGATLCQGYTTQHVRKEGAACSLFGLRAGLLVVEDAEHLCGVAVGGSEYGFESGKAH